MSEVVVHEILEGEGVHFRAAPDPAYVHHWVTRTPMTHGPGIASTTAAGPAAKSPVASNWFVAVGNDNTGPMPQMVFARLGRRQEELLLNVANPARRRAAPRRNADERDDCSGDDVLARTVLIGITQLGIEYHLRLLPETAARIEVELKGERRQIAYGVLGFLGQRARIRRRFLLPMRHRARESERDDRSPSGGHAE